MARRADATYRETLARLVPQLVWEVGELPQDNEEDAREKILLRQHIEDIKTGFEEWKYVLYCSVSNKNCGCGANFVVSWRSTRTVVCLFVMYGLKWQHQCCWVEVQVCKKRRLVFSK